MGLFDKIKGPIILKEDSSAKNQLKALEQFLYEENDTKIRAALERDIAVVKAGIFGEDTILYELRNSHIPLFVLHDLYLEHEGLTAQIDFLVITRRRHFVIECKNLCGDITINNSGDFIRKMDTRQEGIYSPITQCKRHLELIKQIRRSEQSNVLTKSIFEKTFYLNYRSVVVLANPKTILNDRYAPKEIKSQVIRADQLIDYIRKVNKEDDAIDSSESATEQLANYFLSINHNCKTDYLEKYRVIKQEQERVTETKKSIHNSSNVGDHGDGNLVPICPKCGVPMVKRKAGKGSNIGNEFWGCSNFPKCRSTINIE
jgi:Zn-finger domain associated with topoisomerase type I